MKGIGVIGCGSLGKQLPELLAATIAWDKMVFFDDVLCAKHAENSFPFESFLDQRFAHYDFYVGLGYRHLNRKSEILHQLQAANRSTPAFAHPSCHLHPTCRIGDGCLIYPLCNIGQEAELACGVLLNNSVVVSHNSYVGEATYCAPGVVLSGHVIVGIGTFLGTGTLVANNQRIGDQARVGIGTVVTQDIPDGASAIGNPMRILRKPLGLE
jgi:sugar O-acyltransferase (sialic acid O-acetyltransferase NeuD family)